MGGKYWARFLDHHSLALKLISKANQLQTIDTAHDDSIIWLQQPLQSYFPQVPTYT